MLNHFAIISALLAHFAAGIYAKPNYSSFDRSSISIRTKTVSGIRTEKSIVKYDNIYYLSTKVIQVGLGGLGARFEIQGSRIQTREGL